ncbi:MAG: hypothetical protein HYZ50_07905 [Deltaproteobacteria bacterium]|nr:hypothetical protein [Deltaproteobacteria bacterium]
MASIRAKKTARQQRPAISLTARAKRLPRAEQDPRTSTGPGRGAEPSAPWCAAMKQLMASYLDTTAKLTTETLRWCENATSWARNTPWALLFITPLTSANTMVEETTRFMRTWWRIERPNGSPEKR